MPEDIQKPQVTNLLPHDFLTPAMESESMGYSNLLKLMKDDRSNKIHVTRL
ncbi:MAG: hypothetical protein JWN25_724 [Verrucomicrobiales bacterium]|nr:hypothetical protein [Verrucomicrobiales bacterium]